jgi:hypothetical protein
LLRQLLLRIAKFLGFGTELSFAAVIKISLSGCPEGSPRQCANLPI